MGADRRPQTVGNDLKLCAKAADGLQPLDMIPNGAHLGCGFAHRAPARPGDTAGDQASMGHDQHVIVTKRFLDIQARRAVKAIAANRGEFEGRTQVILGRGQPAIGAERQTKLYEATACGFAHVRREKAAFN